MSEPRLQRFPLAQGVSFETSHHARAGSTHATARSAQHNDSDFARVVMVRLDGRMAMVVVGAGRCLDLAALRLAIGCEALELVPESEFVPLFLDDEAGAVPPFGDLYGLDIFVEESLSEDEEIALSTDPHVELIRIPFALFEQLVHPERLRRIGRIAH